MGWLNGKCSRCKGEGRIYRGTRRSGRYDWKEEVWETCSLCEGSGEYKDTTWKAQRSRYTPCRRCQGTGREELYGENWRTGEYRPTGQTKICTECRGSGSVHN